jgi:tRNA-specific 2-thiouridylase
MSDKNRVVIGLSGGVDSSVAAALLIEQGYEVEGVYLECYNEPGCRSDQDKADALKVAIKLGIRFQTLDFRRQYREQVIEYFYREYEAGRTPNPDVMCNREIKFGIFYDWAMEKGFDYIATGHYCRITNRESPGSILEMAKDESKDQSYFLWQIPQDHLEHILFPLGNMLKSEVRVKAKELGLHTATKPDSMGICFIGEVDVAKLLKERLGEKPGNVVLRSEHLLSQGSDLCKIGTHRGLWFYTIGQRVGVDMRFQMSDIRKAGFRTNNMPPLYVIAKDKEKNELIVGKREETMKNRFQMSDIRGQWEAGTKLWVRIRNLGELHEVSQCHRDTVTQQVQVETLEPIFGVAEGQSAVFYDKNGVLVGGGIIV